MIVPDKIIRSKRKTLCVCVKSDGQVIVRAPYGVSKERIDKFVSDKQGWLKKHLQKAAKNSFSPPEKDLDGYTFSLLGKACEIRLCGIKKPIFDEAEYKLYLPFEESEKQYNRLRNWLKSYAKSVFLRLAEKRAAQMNASFASLSVTQAKTRWGSCSGKNSLNFSFRLVYMPIEVVDYVVVHELAHVFHKNHSAAFWRKVEEYAPNYKALRAYLKEKSALAALF